MIRIYVYCILCSVYHTDDPHPQPVRHLTRARACPGARACHMAHGAGRVWSLTRLSQGQDYSHYAEGAVQCAIWHFRTLAYAHERTTWHKVQAPPPPPRLGALSLCRAWHFRMLAYARERATWYNVQAIAKIPGPPPEARGTFIVPGAARFLAFKRIPAKRINNRLILKRSFGLQTPRFTDPKFT